MIDMAGEDTPLEAGSNSYVPAGTLYQYRIDTNGIRFICIVSEERHVV